jgi:hypothetical protein
LKSSIQLDLDIIDKAPAPFLAWLKGGNDGMPRSGGMFARVSIIRVIATTHMPTRPA